MDELNASERRNRPRRLELSTTALQAGTVVGERSIGYAELAGVAADDDFGSAVVSLGDIDADGVNDIAVGAWEPHDRADSGATYVLRMNADGSVKASMKIANSAGGLGTELLALDMFGISLAAIGDLDGDNVTELVVGAWGDDDASFSNNGAVYVLFLQSDGSAKAY